MIETDTCWWCHGPSSRPLCPECAKDPLARAKVTAMIRNGQKTAPKANIRKSTQRNRTISTMNAKTLPDNLYRY